MTALQQLEADQADARRQGRCACLCGKPAAFGSKYHLVDRCRMRAYRRKRDAMAADAGIQINATITTIEQQAGQPSRSRNGDGQRRRQARRKRNPDVRVSYRKALAAITLAVGDEQHAKTILDPCLPPRLKETA